MNAKERLLSIASLAAVLACGLVAPARAQEDKGSVERLVRDQRTIKSRLEKLQSKMERLSGRLKQENKPSGDLLSAALEEISKTGLSSRMEEVVPDLTASRFASVERQDQVLKDLERVYAILLARKDLDQLEEQLMQVREALRTIGNLKSMQHDLTKSTAATSQAEQALVKKALEAAAELSKQQAELLKATEQASKSASDASKSQDAAARSDSSATPSLAEMKQALDRLAARQAAVSKQTKDAIDGNTADVKKKLDEAAAAESSALDRVKSDDGAKAGQDPKDAKASPLTSAEKDGFVADQRRAEDALEALEKLAEKSADPKGPANATAEPSDAKQALAPEMKAAIEKAKSAAKSAQSAAERNDRAAAEQSAKDALDAVNSARAQLEAAKSAEARAVPKEVAAEQAKIAEEAQALAKALENASQAKSDEQVAKAASAERDAAKESTRAAEESKAADPSGAPEAQQKALDKMNEARAALEQLAKAEQAERDQLAAKQNYLESRARDLKEMLSRWNPTEQSEQTTAQSSRERAENARESMSKSAEKMQSGQQSESKADQQSALDELAKLQDELTKQRDAQQQNAQKADREKFQDLANRQQDLEKRARDLMDRLKKMKERKDTGAMDQAAGRMSEAKQKLDEEDGAEAVPKQEDAEKYLDKAKQELEQEEQRYQNLRQEELLFRVKDSLTKLRGDQADLLAKTGEIELERAQKGGQLSRGARSRVKDLSNAERALKAQNDEVAGKIKDDGAQVFSFLFDRNSEDLGRAAEALGARPNLTDESTQSVQREVIERYDQMLVAMKDEMDRRQKAAQDASDEQKGQNQPTKQSLIPKVAELLMVKQLEESAMRKVDAFSRSLPESDQDGSAELDAAARDRLQRLAHQHSRITELFKQLVDAANGAPPQPAGDDAKENGK